MDHKITITVIGKDRASGAFRNVGGALSNMGQIAGGILGANLFMRIAGSLQGIVTKSVMATGAMQQMQVGMEGLIAREIMQADAARVAADETGLLNRQYENIGDALPAAETAAAGLMDELARIAIFSPYQVETIQNTFRTAMAFGYSTDQAKDYTTALLNVAAGTGANNEMMGRMAYNLAQVRMQGRVTAVDIRQLSMAGFDLVGVLRYMGDELGVQIDNHEDFNKAIDKGLINWDQFTELFAKYADDNFGGASERMSRTLTGLSSTFADVFTLTMPQILGDSVEMFTEFANGILDAFLDVRESPLMDVVAQRVTDATSAIIDGLQPFADAIGRFFQALGAGYSPAQAFEKAILVAFSGNARKNVFDLIDGIRGLVDSFFRLRDAAAPFVTKIADFISEFVSFKDVLIALGVIVGVFLVNAFLGLVASMAPLFVLIGVIALLRNAWENNWFGIRDTLTQVWYETILPAIEQLKAWLQVNLPIAIQALSDYWNNVLYPAMLAFWEWVQTYVFPVIGLLIDWFSVVIPDAIAVLSDIWTNILLPAIQTVWEWISTVLFPLFVTLLEWLSVNLPEAVAWLQEVWAMLVDFYNESLGPLLEALAELLSVTLALALEILAGLWQNVLLPALTEVWAYLSENLIPIFENIAEWLGEKLGIEIGKGVSFLETLQSTFDKVGQAISTVIGYIKDMVERLQNATLPDWLVGHSPSPFENTLAGIAEGLDLIAKKSLPAFDANVSGGFGAGANMPRLGAAAPITVNVNVDSMSTDVDISNVAYRVAEEISRRQRT